MFVLPPSLTHSACDCTYHHVCSLSTSHSVSCACTHYNSLTLCACDYTHHDVCLCPLTHTLCLWLHSPRCILTLTVSLTCDCTRHYVCPRPFTTIFTSPPQSLILLHMHSPACTSSPSHQLTRFVTHVWLTFALLFTHNSVCDCTHRHACPHPLTDSLTLRYLWLHLLSCMLALILSRTHSTCDYTHHHTCVHHQEWETGWSGEGLLWGDRCSVCDEIGHDNNACVNTTDVWYT